RSAHPGARGGDCRSGADRQGAPAGATRRDEAGRPFREAGRGGRGVRRHPQRPARPAGRIRAPHPSAGAAAALPHRGPRARDGKGAAAPGDPRDGRGLVIQGGWLLADESEGPEGNEWLGPAERKYVGTLRLPWRRAAWRLGRWAARQAIATYLDDPPASIEIRPAPDGAPEVLLDGKPAPVALSFGHRAAHAACADSFTAAERDQVENASPEDRPLLANLLWSAKESVLKALRTGLRADT